MPGLRPDSLYERIGLYWYVQNAIQEHIALADPLAKTANTSATD